MVKKSKKSKSKRTTLNQKYKVEKKVRVHHKKQRRALKKSKRNGSYQKKLQKDPGIPNDYPMKEKFLAQMKRSHEQQVAHEKKERVSIRQLAAQSAIRASNFETESKEIASVHVVAGAGKLADESRKAYYRAFKSVVEESDVILQVLDARDPLGCRCRSVEQSIMEKDASKKIVLVLNKVDLVPKPVVQKWLTYLRHELPTVAFKCSTQSQRNNLSGKTLGADVLLQLLKNYSRSGGMKKSVTVGIIGYPNVGKSSLINSLKRQKVVSVGARPGVTTTQQEIRLDKKIVLLDCPGIVFDANEVGSADAVLRNAIEVEKLEDPVAVIAAVLRRVPVHKMTQMYQIARYSSEDEFLSFVARRKGKLKKGAIPDYRAAAISVLKDWNSGKIAYHTPPPEAPIETSTIVTQWSAAFNLDAIVAQEKREVMDALETVPMDLSDDEMEADEAQERQLIIQDTKKKISKKRVIAKPTEEDLLNATSNKDQRKQQKKKQKQKKRQQLQQPTGEAYSFAQDFIPTQQMQIVSDDDDDDDQEKGQMVFDI